MKNVKMNINRNLTEFPQEKEKRFLGNRTLSKRRHAEKLTPVNVNKSFNGQAGVSLFDDSSIGGMKINQS